MYFQKLLRCWVNANKFLIPSCPSFWCISCAYTFICELLLVCMGEFCTVHKILMQCAQNLMWCGILSGTDNHPTAEWHIFISHLCANCQSAKCGRFQQHLVLGTGHWAAASAGNLGQLLEILGQSCITIHNIWGRTAINRTGLGQKATLVVGTYLPTQEMKQIVKRGSNVYMCTYLFNNMPHCLSCGNLVSQNWTDWGRIGLPQISR